MLNILSTVPQQLAFSRIKTDPSLFTLNTECTAVYILVYADVIIIAIDNIIKELNTSFAIKDLGQLHYFLGIKVIHMKITTYCLKENTS